MTLEELVKQYKQHEVDFLLPQKKGDHHAYLDLYLLYSSPDKRWQEVQSLIFYYLNHYLKQYRTKKIAENELLTKLQFPEVSYIALGHCVTGISGRGTGGERAYILKEDIFDNPDVQKIGLSAIASTSIAIGGLGPDLLSDMVANFGMRHLLEYTAEQAEMYGLETREFQISRALTKNLQDWEPIPRVRLPFFASTGEPRILVPRHIVRRLPLLTTGGFFDTYLKYFLRQEESDRLNSLRTLGRKPKISRVTLKDIIEKLVKKYESVGEATREISLQRPHLVENYLKDPFIFKRKVKKREKEAIDWVKYKRSLQNIKSGAKFAHAYAEEIRKIFTALYSGNLTSGRLEKQSEGNMYYYDITFGNSADTTFFRFLYNQKIKSGVVIFEVKNYDRTKIGNPQYSQAAAYTIANGRELVFLARRKLISRKDIEKARRHFLTHKILLLPISDEDIKELLDKRRDNPNNFDIHLVSRAQEILEA